MCSCIVFLWGVLLHELSVCLCKSYSPLACGSCHPVNGLGIRSIQVQSNKNGVICIPIDHSLSISHRQECHIIRDTSAYVHTYIHTYACMLPIIT